MKKKILSVFLLMFLLLPIALTGCDLFGGDENGYEQNSTIGQVNAKMQKTMYGLWESKKTEEGYERYTSARGSFVYEYEQNYSVNTFDGQNFKVWKDKEYIATYTDDGDTVRVYSDGSRSFVDSNITREPSAKVSVEADENGYLFITDSYYMIYFNKAVNKFYINEKNTKIFEYGDETFEVPSSQALTNALNNLDVYHKFYLPNPGEKAEYLLSKDYIVSDKIYGFSVYFSRILPLEYIEILKNNNYEVALSEHYGLFAPNYDGSDNVWLATDKNSEFVFSIEVGWLSSYGSGTEIKVYKSNLKALYGVEVTANEDWTEEDKQNMVETYGSEIPFIKLGSKYSIGNSLKSNGDEPVSSNLGSKCYEIYDGHYRYLLEDYGQILEEKGFNLYNPPVNFESGYEEVFEWWYSEESKYYNCYINAEKDLAIRIKYDRVRGNLIQIFKYSQMTTSGYFN